MPDLFVKLHDRGKRIAAACKEAYEDLELLADEHDRDRESWEYTFNGERGRYVVTMGVLDGIPRSSRIRREIPGDAQL